MSYSLVSLQWNPGKTPPSHNPENGYHLWQGAPGQKPIPSLDATLGTRVYEAPAQGTQCVAYKGKLESMTPPKGFQSIKYPIPIEYVQ